jgi:hypothetical protein
LDRIQNRLRIVAIQQTAEAAEDGAFFASATAGLGGGGGDAAGQAAQGQGLKPDAAGTTQGGEEEPFAAEERALDFAHVLDVVIDAGLEGHDAAGIDADDFAGGEFALVDGAAGMNEGEAVALEPFQDKSFPAKKPRSQSFGKRDAQAHAFGGAEEGVFLR